VFAATSVNLAGKDNVPLEQPMRTTGS